MTLHHSLASFPASQREAAYALGLTRFKILQVIVLPQVIGGCAPAIVNAVASLFRNTTIVTTTFWTR